MGVKMKLLLFFTATISLGDQAAAANSLGEHVSTIAITMADGKHEGSRCRAVMEICDSDGNCCQTLPDGRGLYNGKYRASGQTDVYSNTTILGNCAQEGSLVGDIIRAKLTVSDPGAGDGWGVEWIRITKSTGEMFNCPFNGWLKKNERNSKTVNCTRSGDQTTTTSEDDQAAAGDQAAAASFGVQTSANSLGDQTVATSIDEVLLKIFGHFG